MRSSRKVEDVPELMQQIQLLLPIKDSTRTSILSKSWLHAWYTIPTLRFLAREAKHLKMVDNTLNRYLRENIPIERFDLNILIENPESASLAEKWIRSVATKPCLKELALIFSLTDASLTLPEEILSVAKNLTNLNVLALRRMHSVWIKTSIHPPIINCVSLREVSLEGVQISQEVLDGILSSCSMLVKLDISLCSQRDLKTIKVVNHSCLYGLRIFLEQANVTALEIGNLPNLRLLNCRLETSDRQSTVCSLPLGSSVTELLLGGDLITDDASLNMIKSGFPFLESLTLDMRCWTLESFYFTSSTLKRLSLRGCNRRFINVQVHAPRLVFFLFGGYTMPSLLFPTSNLIQTTFWLILYTPPDASFFLKMREALALSTECDVSITIIRNHEPPPHISIDDLRSRLLFPPANNVQKLEFHTVDDECMWESSLFFDVFFEICHPKQVLAKPDSPFTHANHFCKLMLRELLDKKTTKRDGSWPSYLKHVQIRRNKRWETLTNSHRSFLDGPPPINIDFRLDWR